MKNFLLLIAFSISTFLTVGLKPSMAATFQASSTDSTSKVNCLVDLSTMVEYMKIDLYDYALESWTRLFNNCPDASKNIYIHGAKIFQKRIELEKDPAKRRVLYDSLMLVYDQRIKYYDEEAAVLGRKGMDIIRYQESDYEIAYAAFLRSIGLAGGEVDMNVIPGLMRTSGVMHKSGKIDTPTLLNNYLLCYEALDVKKKKGDNPGRVDHALGMINAVLSGAKISDCESIENALRPKFESGADETLLNTIAELLTVGGCTNSNLLPEVNEKLMEINPDPQKAYDVAKHNMKNENFPKAVEYLGKAIEHESRPEQKALYQYQLAALLTSRMGKHKEAFDLTAEIISNKPGWGEPYLLKATVMLAGIRDCTSDNFERNAANWLAVDYCWQAIQADPAIEQKAKEQIAQCKSSYPSVEDTFFRSLKEGDSYTVGCWINAVTRVKMR